jgi:hypothetical protein
MIHFADHVPKSIAHPMSVAKKVREMPQSGEGEAEIPNVVRHSSLTV